MLYYGYVPKNILEEKESRSSYDKRKAEYIKNNFYYNNGTYTLRDKEDLFLYMKFCLQMYCDIVEQNFNNALLHDEAFLKEDGSPIRIYARHDRYPFYEMEDVLDIRRFLSYESYAQYEKNGYVPFYFRIANHNDIKDIRKYCGKICETLAELEACAEDERAELVEEVDATFESRIPSILDCRTLHPVDDKELECFMKNIGYDWDKLSSFGKIPKGLFQKLMENNLGNYNAAEIYDTSIHAWQRWIDQYDPKSDDEIVDYTKEEFQTICKNVMESFVITQKRILSVGNFGVYAEEYEDYSFFDDLPGEDYIS